ncbi:MAG: glycosyltransferase, partial [Nitrospiraceae bacterium]
HAMDIFVLPSLNEGIPMALLEAMAAARPIVASRVGGIPEVVEHSISGLLVAPGMDQELAKGCQSMMENPELARCLGAAGRQRVEKEFASAMMADKVAKLYHELAYNGRSQ